MVRVLMSFICTFPPFVMKLLKADLAIPASLLVAPTPCHPQGFHFPLPCRERMLRTCLTVVLDKHHKASPHHAGDLKASQERDELLQVIQIRCAR